MEDLKNWALSSMGDFLRASMEPSIIEDLTIYILNIDNADSARAELELTLGLELSDHSQGSLLLRSRKLNFIDMFIEKRFAVASKKKQKPVRVELNKKNIENVQRALMGPGFAGKKKCYCMAREHDLIGNCMACGKIVCALEGRGACLFCGHQVVAKGEVPGSIPEKASFIQALKHKDKLIDYDRNAEERLAVIDDQNDWYDIADNTWLSAEDREQARLNALAQQKRVEEAQKLISLSINFQSGNASVEIGGKKVIEASIKENEEKAHKFFMQASKNIPVNKDLELGSKELYDNIIQKLEKERDKERENKPRERFTGMKVIQNEDPFNNLVEENVRPTVFEPFVYAECDDKRQCLTMHQPWASLLVLGFKRYEGREWGTDFRGPLWIHASAKKPSDEDIEAVENQYRQLYMRTGVSMPEFPHAYPTGVLLGRIELINVLTSEEYFAQTPEEAREENSSRFLFVIKNPMRLLIPIRMQGSKKIYSLDFDTWDGAKYGLRRVSTSW